MATGVKVEKRNIALPRSTPAPQRLVDMATATPRIVEHVANVSFPGPLQRLRDFYAGPGREVKIFLDDACALPGPSWKETWAAPKQWGKVGDKNWATKAGAQGFIPRMIALSPFVTSDWRTASASVVVLFARQYAGGPAIAQQQCLQRLRSRSAAWRATNGSRHFFILTDSRGPCAIDGKYKARARAGTGSPGRKAELHATSYRLPATSHALAMNRAMSTSSATTSR